MNDAGEVTISGQQLSTNSTSYQTQECILYGAISFDLLPMLESRLTGLCDPGCQEFSEHEMSFTQKMTKSVIKLRRRFGLDQHQKHLQKFWLMKYIGVPEGNTKLPVIVRKETCSMTTSTDMMEFMKSLGLFMEFEFMTEGKLYTKGNVKVMFSKLSTSTKPGEYTSQTIRKIGEKALVEMSVSLPESADYVPAAKELREFADQLQPLVEMTKVECAARIVRLRA